MNDRILKGLKTEGFSVISASETLSWLGADSLADWWPLWEDLPRDEHLKDGGRYRSRRHGSFVLSEGQVSMVPHRAHYQPKLYNALHGGMLRWFEPLATELAASGRFGTLLSSLGELFSKVRPPRDRTWFVEAHAFRIDTRNGVGRPTPEGAHRDGVDFVAVLLIGRKNVRGGESRVFPIEGNRGLRLSLELPGDALLLDDTRVIHETTPIVSDREDGFRDTLVLTFREGSFQDPEGDEAEALRSAR